MQRTGVSLAQRVVDVKARVAAAAPGMRYRHALELESVLADAHAQVRGVASVRVAFWQHSVHLAVYEALLTTPFAEVRDGWSQAERLCTLLVQCVRECAESELGLAELAKAGLPDTLLAFARQCDLPRGKLRFWECLAELCSCSADMTAAVTTQADVLTQELRAGAVGSVIEPTLGVLRLLYVLMTLHVSDSSRCLASDDKLATAVRARLFDDAGAVHYAASGVAAAMLRLLPLPVSSETPTLVVFGARDLVYLLRSRTSSAVVAEDMPHLASVLAGLPPLSSLSLAILDATKPVHAAKRGGAGSRSAKLGRDPAATLIQAAWLGYRTRRQYQRLRRGVLRVQARFRGAQARVAWPDRRQLAAARAQAQAEVAAAERRRIALESETAAMRKMTPSQVVQHMTGREELAATSVQRVWRGHRTRKHVAQLRDSAQQHRAASVVQAAARRWLRLRGMRARSQLRQELGQQQQQGQQHQHQPPHHHLTAPRYDELSEERIAALQAKVRMRMQQQDVSTVPGTREHLRWSAEAAVMARMRARGKIDRATARRTKLLRQCSGLYQEASMPIPLQDAPRSVLTQYPPLIGAAAGAAQTRHQRHMALAKLPWWQGIKDMSHEESVDELLARLTV